MTPPTPPTDPTAPGFGDAETADLTAGVAAARQAAAQAGRAATTAGTAAKAGRDAVENVGSSITSGDPGAAAGAVASAADTAAQLAASVGARSAADSLVQAASATRSLQDEVEARGGTVLAGMDHSRALRDAARAQDSVDALDHSAALLDNVGQLFDPPLRSSIESDPEQFEEIQSTVAVLGGVARGDLAGAFGTVFDQLLEVGLGELLAAGWLEDEHMQRLLGVDPESREVLLLPLSNHELAWGYDPEISLQLGGVGVPVATLRLGVDLVLDLEGFTAVVQQGHLRELRSGRLCLHLRVTHGEQALIDRATEWFDFGGSMRFPDDGVPVTRQAVRTASEASLERLARAGVTPPDPEELRPRRP